MNRRQRKKRLQQALRDIRARFLADMHSPDIAAATTRWMAIARGETTLRATLGKAEVLGARIRQSLREKYRQPGMGPMLTHPDHPWPSEEEDLALIAKRPAPPDLPGWDEYRRRQGMVPPPPDAALLEGAEALAEVARLNRERYGDAAVEAPMQRDVGRIVRRARP